MSLIQQLVAIAQAVISVMIWWSCMQ